jgi:hypothetical protein
MDTFITELSSVIRNWLDASTVSTRPDPATATDSLPGLTTAFLGHLETRFGEHFRGLPLGKVVPSVAWGQTTENHPKRVKARETVSNRIMLGEWPEFSWGIPDYCDRALIRGDIRGSSACTKRGFPVNDIDPEDSGPIDYLVVEFPADRRPDGSALAILRELVEQGTVRVLDLVFLRKEVDGSVVAIDVVDVGLEGDIDVSLFAEASTGLLDLADIADAGSVLEPGASAAVVVYENTWAAPLATALRRSGAQLVASGRIPVQGILASLDALEA